MTTTLPARLHEILRQLDKTTKERDMAPTNIELARICKIGQSSACHYKQELRDLGLITFEDNRPQTTQLTEDGLGALHDIRVHQLRLDGIKPAKKPDPVKQTLRARAIELLVDSHREGHSDFGNGLGALLPLLPE